MHETNETELQKLEAILMLEKEPISLKRLHHFLKTPPARIEAMLQVMNERYGSIGSLLRVGEHSKGYRLCLRDDFEDEVLDHYKVKKKRLSSSVLEVLSIIAYQQPITKMEVDTIRGVNNAIYLKVLLEGAFIKVMGKKEVPGKPLLYGTTGRFLEHFELNSLRDLPPLREVKTYDFFRGKGRNPGKIKKS